MKEIRKIVGLLLALALSMNVFAACGTAGNSAIGSSGGGSESSSANSESSVDSGSDSSSGEHVHDFSGEWKTNAGAHYLQCQVQGCYEFSSYASHKGEAKDCTSKPVCATCGVTYGEPTGHQYTEWKSVGEEKQCYCDCGAYTTLDELVDFTVEIEEDRDPVVLQLSDTQMTSSNTEELCYQYIRQTVNATNPDLILITGDLVYGRFDETGALFQSLITCMESFQIPWAPVFGNHDNESLKGVNWQCEQLEAAEHCLFEQRDLTGNGNYSVGIWQNNTLKRVFYMLDSNGCSSPMIDRDGNEKAQGDNKVQTYAGLAKDQVEWYKNSIKKIKISCPDVKFSMAYHIQNSLFFTAFRSLEGYSDNVNTSGDLVNPINLGTEMSADGNFGFIGRSPKGPWGSAQAYLEELKTLGVDSVFVGHEHCNSASIVYEGIRFQYGQKTGKYDRYNVLLGDNVLEEGDTIVSSKASQSGTPLVGGTVIVLDKADGAIKNGYLYLCGVVINK